MNKDALTWYDRKRILGLPITFTKYGLDSERLYIEKGLISTTNDEIKLYRVTDVSCRRSLSQKLFGVGSIHVLSSDGNMPKLEICNVKKPMEVMRQISEMVEVQRDAKRVLGREVMYGGDSDGDDEDSGLY